MKDGGNSLRMQIEKWFGAAQSESNQAPTPQGDWGLPTS